MLVVWKTCKLQHLICAYNYFLFILIVLFFILLFTVCFFCFILLLFLVFIYLGDIILFSDVYAIKSII